MIPRSRTNTIAPTMATNNRRLIIIKGYAYNEYSTFAIELIWESWSRYIPDLLVTCTRKSESLKYKKTCVNKFVKTHNTIGIMFDIVSTLLSCKISNIMITNKNNMAIAPTYTIISINGIKLKPINSNNPEVFRNTSTNQKTEWIGFKDVITIIAPNNVINDKIIYNCSIKIQGQVPLPPLCYDLLYL